MSSEPLNGLSLVKSNDFVMAKYKASLLENQIMAIALTRIEEIKEQTGEELLQAKLYPGELRQLISDSAHIYRDLKKMSKAITGHTMFIEDGKGNFKSFSIIPNADYIDGIFVITFNRELRNHIHNLSGNFTTLELSVMTSFKKNNSYRLYEILKKDAYKIDKNEAFLKVIHSIAELKFMMGLINTDDQYIKNAIATRNVDWDKLYSKLKDSDKVWERWTDFRTKVLIPAQKELEEKSYIRFDFEGVKEGRKVTKVLFTIYKNTPQDNFIEVIDKKKRILEENNRQLEFPMDLYESLYEDFIGHNALTKEDIDLLIKYAEGNEELVRKSISMADEQAEIRNYMGWLVKCIKNDYGKVGVLSGSHEQYAYAESILEEYNDNKKDIAIKEWEKIKTKDDFEIFAADMFGSYSVEEFEMINDAEELSKMYFDWKKR